MGLPPLLVDTYRRYKKETEVFLNWLAPTARSTGAVDDIFACNASEDAKLGGRARRPKGKDRKAPKQQPKEYKIPLSTFARLANAIANAKNITIPRTMVAILRDVIRARKECAEFYGYGHTHGDEDLKPVDEGHAYFISVLEEVFATLNARLPKEIRNQKTDDEEANQLANLFEHLDLEEPKENDAQSWLPAQLQSPKTPTDTYEIEILEEDIKFTIFCFLKDATDIRLFVRRTWRQYRDGRITLETAALTMNSAISLIERLNLELIASYPFCVSHFDMIVFFLPDMAERKQNGTILDTAYTNGNQELSYQTFLCHLSYDFICTFVEGLADPSSIPLTASEVVLAKCLLQLRAVASARNPVLARDGMIRAIAEVLNTGTRPSWTVFAVQLLWDTQRELGSDIARGYTDAHNAVRWILHSVEDTLSAGYAGYFGDRYQKNAFGLQEFKSYLEDSLGRSDYCYIQEIMDFVKGQDRPYFEYEPHFLYRNHPMMCGLLSQDSLAKLRMIAKCMADMGMVSSCAHFYNAASQTGLLPADLKWKDMDWIIEQQGEEHMFVGERPRVGTITTFTKHYNLSCGFSLSHYAQNKRKPTRDGELLLSTLKGRKLRYMSKYVDVIVRQSGTKLEITSVVNNAGALIEQLLDHSSEGKTKGKPKSTAKQNRNTEKMTPIEMLTNFRSTLQQEELPMRFDLSKFTTGCFEVLQRIKQLVTTKAPLDYPPDGWHFKRTQGLNACIGLLLYSIDDNPLQNEPQYFGAAKILREFIETESDTEYSKAIARLPRMAKGDIDDEEEEPSFEVPPEDLIDLGSRDCVRDAPKDRILVVVQGERVTEVVYDGVA